MSIKIGIVGTGGFSQKHIELLRKINDVEVVSVCGTSKEKADLFAEKFKISNAYDDFGTMLDTELLDGVYLCVPPMAHGEMEIALINHHIPFFIEKPLGVTKDLPKKVMKALNNTSLITSVGYHFRYSQSVQKLKDILKDHKIGMVTGQWVGSMPMVSWWRQQNLSGGQLNEQATHIIDLLRYIVGEIDELHAFEGQRVVHQEVSNVTVSDVGTLNMRFKSGVIGTMVNTCVLPEGLGSVNMSFYTDKGILTWTPGQLIVQTANKKEVLTDEEDPYLEEDRAFIEAIKTKDRQHILSPYQDAFITQSVTDAANRSAENNVSVHLDLEANN